MKKHPTIELLENLNDVVIYALETLTCLAIFYLIYHFLLRKESSFHYNRGFLLAAVVCSFSFPLMNFSFDPNTTPTVLNSIHQVGNGVSDEPIIEAQKAYSYTITAESQRPFLLWWEILLLIYVAGVLFRGIQLFGHIKTIKDVIWYKRHCTRFKEHYFFVKTDGTLPTFAFFNYLFWDNSLKLNAYEEKQILEHEKAHIREKHSYDVIFMELLRTVFWFNPFLYLYKGLLEEAHEYAADRAVAQKNGANNYTKVLVRIVFQRMGLDLTSHFNKNKVLKRVKMLEKEHHNNWLKYLLPIPVTALLLFVFSFEPEIARHDVKIGEIEFVSQSSDFQSSAAPIGGLNNWNRFMETNIEFPEIARSANIAGEAQVTFTVNKRGKLQDLYFNKTLGYNTEKAIILALERSSLWNPAIKDGQKVDSQVSIPITFGSH
jgi:hypothetical protein